MGAWLAFRNNTLRRDFDSLHAAQRSFERPYYVTGAATIDNRRTGEAWRRIGGGWYKTRDAAVKQGQ